MGMLFLKFLINFFCFQDLSFEVVFEAFFIFYFTEPFFWEIYN